MLCASVSVSPPISRGSLHKKNLIHTQKKDTAQNDGRYPLFFYPSNEYDLLTRSGPAKPSAP